jgi:hypothetical protein
LGNGLPFWLLNQADEIDAILPEAGTAWLKTMSQQLSNQQWPHGPVIALHLQGQAGQLQPGSLSPHLSEVKWRIWLRKHYAGIEALNAAHGTNYRTVNEVKFPANWSAQATPQEKDAQAFLDEVQRETILSYRQTLVGGGWQIPIYTDDTPPVSGQPVFLKLAQPIQADPDPADVGRRPVWAASAPIRADGEPRPAFWQQRQQVWPLGWPETRLVDQTLVSTWPDGAFITRSGDTTLKLSLAAGAKAQVYRLYFSGQLLLESQLKLSRGKLTGLYRAGDETGLTDLYLVINNPAAPLSEFPLAYLSHLLVAQAHTLERCAGVITALGQALSVGQAIPIPPEEKKTPARSYLLDEARRGLRQAEAALRKATASIGDLESGFSTILGKSRSARLIEAAVYLNLGAFDPLARGLLAEVGETCAAVGPALHAAAHRVDSCLSTPGGFTIEQYQQTYTATLADVDTVKAALFEIIGLLRLELAAERLPLVTWRLHDQIQEIAESLRWGVLRG